jgi:hypothetical protein
MAWLLVGLAVGLAIGIVGFALWSGQQRWSLGTGLRPSQQTQAIQDLQRRLNQAEQDHEQRLRQATEQLRKDYEAKLAQQQAAKSAEPVPSPTAPTPSAEPAPAPTSSPVAETEPVTPPPVPAPEPTPPPVSAPVAPAPAANVPISAATLMAQSYTPASAAKRITQSYAPASAAALMAQSYAPQAEQRVAVVEAISEALAISSPQQAGRWLPLLGRLSRDPDSTVRLATVQTLAAMPGQRSLPWLRRALQDSEPDVVAAAHEAISRFKGRSRPKAKQKARRLPKNR